MLPPFTRCWRCKLLGLECLRGSICRHCRTLTPCEADPWGIRGLGCCRKSLEHLLQHSFQGLAHVGSGKYHIRHDNGEEYKINVGFTQTPRDIVENGTILDLDTRDFSQHLEQSKSLLFKFIDQFEEVKTRWRNKYEEGTFLLIASAARYQKELLAPYTRVSADKQDEATLIATLLRCLVMADDIFAVDMYWSTLIILKKSEVRELRSEANTDYWGLESSVTVQPIPRSSRRSIQAQVRKYPQGLPTTLKRAIAVVQQVMFKRRPQDLPYLIYSLVLLDLIVLALQPWAKFMVPVAEAGDDVQGILKTLCDLYLFCSDNMHPLSEGFDISKYEALVDSDTIAVEHFQALNQRWKETGLEEYVTLDTSFYSRIDGFAHDMLWD